MTNPPATLSYIKHVGRYYTLAGIYTSDGDGKKLLKNYIGRDCLTDKIVKQKLFGISILLITADHFTGSDRFYAEG